MEVYSVTLSDLQEIANKAKESLLQCMEKDGTILDANKLIKRYFIAAGQEKGTKTIMTYKAYVDPFVEIFDQELKEDGTPAEVSNA